MSLLGRFCLPQGYSYQNLPQADSYPDGCQASPLSMQLSDDFKAPVGTFQTVTGFNGGSLFVPRVIFDACDVLLPTSVRKALKAPLHNKYGHIVPVSTFNSLKGLRLRCQTETVLVLNSTGKDRLCALLQVSAAGVYASDSL